MSTRHSLRQRQRQREDRNAHHLPLSIEQEISRTLHYEQYVALRSVYEPIVQAAHAIRHEVYDITDQHCDTIVVGLREFLHRVKTCITILNGPVLSAEARPYLLVMKLSALHRVLIDTQVIIENVRGQSRCGQLASDPTGSYWHLRTALRDIVRDYQSLLALLSVASAAPLLGTVEKKCL